MIKILKGKRNQELPMDKKNQAFFQFLYIKTLLRKDLGKHA